MKASNPARLSPTLAVLVILGIVTMTLQSSLAGSVEAAKPEQIARIYTSTTSCGVVNTGVAWENNSRTKIVEVDVAKLGQNTVTYIEEISHPQRNGSFIFNLFSGSFVGGIGEGDTFEVTEIRLKERRGGLLFTATNPPGSAPITTPPCP